MKSTFSDTLDALLAKPKDIITKYPEAGEAIPKWDLVHEAKPVTVKVEKSNKKIERVTKCAIILPDTQIGYRQIKNKYVPFHDEAAMEISLQIIGDLQPDRVIQLGDFLDLPQFGKYVQEPSWATTTQMALDYGHEYLAKIKALCPVVDICDSNHDIRLQNYILANASAAFGIKRACTDERPVLSLQNLLRLDDLGITFHEGYPHASKIYINSNLLCLHGATSRSGPQGTAKAIMSGENVSVIHGHTHKASYYYETRPVRNGYKTYMCGSPGTLSRIDGMVPSFRSGLKSDGTIPVQYEQWQQGLGVVYYETEGDEHFDYHHVSINDGRSLFNGKVYECQ